MLGQWGTRVGTTTLNPSHRTDTKQSFPDGPLDLSVKGNPGELLEYNLGDGLHDPGEGKGRFLDAENTIHGGNG